MHCTLCNGHGPYSSPYILLYFIYRKKKKDKLKTTIEETTKKCSAKEVIESQEASTASGSSSQDPSNSTPGQLKLTKAEQTFRATQERLQTKRIMDKASKSHKQRVEAFNRHLDSLSEHYDIPKVSWTK